MFFSYHYLASISLGIMIGFAIPVKAQQGFVDADSVLHLLPEYAQSERFLADRVQTFEDSLQVLYIEYNRLLQGHHSVDSASIAAFEQQLREQEKEFELLQRFVQEDIAHLQQGIQTNLEFFLQRKLEAFCRAYGLTMVVDREALLYCTECTDFTAEFAVYIQKN